MFFFQSTNMSNIKLTVQNAAALKQWNDTKGHGRLDFMQTVQGNVLDSILCDSKKQLNKRKINCLLFIAIVCWWWLI